jgi:hypothetical protein
VWRGSIFSDSICLDTSIGEDRNESTYEDWFSLAPVDGFFGGRGWRSGLMLGWSVLGLVVGVYAGLLLSAVVVCVSRIFSLSLLATVRGGTSFLCPKRQRNEAKKALSTTLP